MPLRLEVSGVPPPSGGHSSTKVFHESHCSLFGPFYIEREREIEPYILLTKSVGGDEKSWGGRVIVRLTTGTLPPIISDTLVTVVGWKRDFLSEIKIFMVFF